MKKKTLLVSLGICILLFIIAYSTKNLSTRLSARPNINDTGRNVYPVTHPLVMDTSYTSDYVANIQANKYVELRSKIEGFLDKVYVDEGQSVKKGQLLFSLNNEQYEAELMNAQSELKSAIADARTAEVELQNTKLLLSKNVVSETELELAQSKYDALNAKVDEARSQMESAKIKLACTRIVAPFDGIIGRIPNKTGSLVEDGSLLTTIADNSSVYAYFNVSENEYLNIMTSGLNSKTDLASGENNNQDENRDGIDHNPEGQKVNLVLADQQLYPYPGKIESVDNNIDKETGNMTFRASFPNPGHLLEEGATGLVRIRKEIKNAIIIPQKVTFDVQDKIYVFTLDDNNTIVRKSIVPFISLPNIYILKSGLTAADKIIYEGIQSVRDGDKVNYQLVSFLPQSQESQLAMAGKKQPPTE